MTGAGPTPVVSVVMPAFNAVGTLERAVRTVQAQTLRAWRLIVVDDGSTDGTGELARALAATDARIDALSQRNAGPGAARNAGLDRARGEYVAFLDADDAWRPTHLEDLVAAERRAGTGAAASDFAVVGPGGVVYEHRRASASFGWDELLREWDLVSHGHIVRRDRLGALRFDPALRGYEDTDLWLRLAEGGTRWACVPRVTAEYRVEPGSLTKDCGRMLRDGVEVVRRAFARRHAGKPAPSPLGECRARWQLLTMWSARAAAMGDAAGALRMFAEADRPRLACAAALGRASAYQLAQGLGVWPEPGSAGAWAGALRSFWEGAAEWSRRPAGFAGRASAAFAQASVRPADVASHLMEGVRGGGVTIVGLGRNGRLLAEAALARGLKVFGRDDAGVAIAGVEPEAMHDPVPPGREVVISPDRDAALARRFPGAARWARARLALASRMLGAVAERPARVGRAA